LAASLLPRWIAGKKAILGAGPLPYAIPAMRIEFLHDDPGIPLCWWRSVAHSSNCFAVESFLDELATAAGRDPVDLRLDLLTPTPRLRHVVELAAASSAWSSPAPAGIHRGIAAHDFQETMMAVVAEVSVDDWGRIRVHRMVCAVDCGIAVNPRNIEAQVQNALVFGLTATLKSSITFADGCAERRNFDTFPLLRMNEMPKIETHIVPSTRPPSGIGEAAVPLAGPAIVNALFAATGKRVRRLHVRPSDLR
jgi:isoquinoline 1-oxidoreductase beta subunit